MKYVFSKFIKLWLGDVLKLQTLNGFCQYGAGNKDVITEIDTYDANGCYYQCKVTDGCVAFSYITNALYIDCALYRGGPYTKGNGRGLTTCYLMPIGDCC